MELVSVCPLRATSLLWQKGPASWVLTVIAKGTFDLAPGELRLAEDQEAPNHADEFWDDDPSRSLYAPTDLAPLKMRADVILVGSAYAPGGVPARGLTARILCGKIDKAIDCFADRVVAHDGSILEGSGFTRMPLVWERAAGGPGTANPVGMRRDARDGYGRITLPNLQPPGSRPNGPEGIEPVGFGSIAPRWPTRLEKLGRYANAWGHDWHTRPLPGDMDLGHFNAAPADQQIPALRDNERMVLENLHREHPRLMTALPGLRPCAFVEGRTGAPFRLPMHADTLWIDTDRARVTVTWRRQLPLERPDEQGRVVVAMEQPGQTLAWSEVQSRVPPPEKPDPATLMPPPPPPPPPPVPVPMAVPSEDHTVMGVPVPLAGRAPAMTLPFAAVESPTAQFTVQRTSEPGRDSALPFMAAAPPPPAAPPAAAPATPWAAKPPAPPPQPPAAMPLPPPMAPPAQVKPVSPPPAQAIDSPWVTGAVAVAAAAPPAPVAPPAFASKTTSSGIVAMAPPAPVKSAGNGRPSEPALSSDILELLWFDADSVPRIRRKADWKPILDALEERPADRDLDDPALADDPMEMEDRREIFEILARALSSDAPGVRRSLDTGVRPDGKFVPQLTLLHADLTFPFDEIGTLRATVSTVSPLVTPGDEALKSAVDAAKDFLKTADELTPPSVAEGMTARVRESFVQSKRTVAETHLEEQTDRVLLSQRCYQKRIVFGGPHLRCLVRMGDDPAIPAYLPEGLAKKLPMFQRFRGRLIAEVHQQADQYETHEAALRVVALARATARRSEW